MNPFLRLAALAIVVAAIGGAIYVLRPPTGVGPPITTPPASPSPMPPSTDGLSQLQAYRSAFAAVCASITRPPEPGPSASPAQLVAFLQATIAMGNDEVARFEALQAPPAIVTDHLANIQTLKDVLALLNHEIDLIEANKLSEVATVDEATGPLNNFREQFAAKYGLSTACP